MLLAARALKSQTRPATLVPTWDQMSPAGLAQDCHPFAASHPASPARAFRQVITYCAYEQDIWAVKLPSCGAGRMTSDHLQVQHAIACSRAAAQIHAENSTVHLIRRDLIPKPAKPAPVELSKWRGGSQVMVFATNHRRAKIFRAKRRG